ncbi:hypothetical protein M3Y99_00553300 [Aphelenchoides fujianensis]|nr:hypothetical protein M3Y99_00553300 [Aphelenchoides fujianensis]
MWPAALFLLAFFELKAEAVVCHDYCLDIIGCNQEQRICEGRFCTFYQHRNLRNTQQTSIKRSCTNDSALNYGPNGARFDQKNRCVRIVDGDEEWLLGLCDTRNYCNYICDTNVHDSSSTAAHSLLATAVLLLLQFAFR